MQFSILHASQEKANGEKRSSSARAVDECRANKFAPAKSAKSACADSNVGTLSRPAGRLAAGPLDGSLIDPASSAYGSFWGLAVRLGKLGALILSVGVAGCLAPPKSETGPHVAPAAQKKATSAPTEPQLPGKVSGKGWQIRWRRRNPKSPAGSPVPVLFADAKSGALANETDAGSARLQRVHAQIFQDGKLSADVEAAQVTANQRDGIILGTGGVTIHSMTDPPDTVITSDRMTWDTHTNKLVAEGNANVRHRAPNGLVSTSSGGRVIYDTATRTVTID